MIEGNERRNFIKITDDLKFKTKKKTSFHRESFCATELLSEKKKEKKLNTDEAIAVHTTG